MAILKKVVDGVAVPCPDFARLRGWRQDIRWPACVLNVEAVPIVAPEEWAAEYGQDWRMRTAMVGFGWWDSPKSKTMHVEMLADTDPTPDSPDGETRLLERVADKLDLFKSALFVATRDFDIAVLEGRFVNREEKIAPIEFAWPCLVMEEMSCKPRNILSACQQNSCAFGPNPKAHLPQDLWAQAWLSAVGTKDPKDRRACWNHMLTDVRRTAEQAYDLSVKTATYDERKAREDYRHDAGLGD